MRQALNVISFIVMFLGGLLVLIAGALAIWGRHTPEYILVGPVLVGGLILLCFGGAGVGWTVQIDEPSGVCSKCGYDLRGLAPGGVCPECGVHGRRT